MQDKNFGPNRHTNHGMPPVQRQPARRMPQPRTIRDWPRDRLVRFTAATADQARHDGAPNIAFMLDSATDAMVALDASDFRLAGALFEIVELRRQLADAHEDLRSERARNAALLAELGPERFEESTRSARSPLNQHTRPTTPHGAVGGDA